MFASLGVDKLNIDNYIQAYKAHYRKISRQKTTLLPSAKEAIKLAYKHAHLGIVTTKTGIYSRELLEHMGLMRYFDTLIGRENVQNPKPNPEPILLAIKELPKVDKYWMVGDTCMDINSAKSAQIDSVALLCGYGTKEQLKACAKNISHNAFEAVEFILAK